MPKALAKSKHGLKASVQEQSSAPQRTELAQAPGDMVSIKHQGSKHRDKALREAMDKSSGRHAPPPPPTPDQMSLQDFPLSV